MQNMVIALFSLLSGSLGAWIIQKTGYKFGILDVPNHRSSHIAEVPKGAGIGILIAVVVSSIYLNISQAFWIPALLMMDGTSF